MRDGGAARLRALAAALLAAVCCAAAFSAAAADRVALVVGNGAYAHAPKLANPVNDAAAVGAALERLGFSVMRVENAGYDALRRRLRDFGRASRGAEVAVAFYAGHGVEVGGRNYLVPVDATLANDGDAAFEAVGLDLVMQSVEGASRFGLVILDACRDNPFVSRMERAGTTRAVGRGLARVEPTGVTLVAYAASAGRTASDGSGRHSPYTAALLEHIAEPGLDVGLLFRRVGESVELSTGGAQKPVYYGSLPSAGAYLSSPPPGGGPEAVPGGQSPADRLSAARMDRERTFWESAERGGTASGYEAYLEAFPSGVYAALARDRLARLGGGGVVSSPGPVPAPVPSGPDYGALESGLGLGRADRVALQSGLNTLGFDAGPVDGAVGPRTRRAISLWQSAKGYEATSYLTREQAEALIAAGREARARDDAAFAVARRSDTVSAYDGYLSAYRSGAHVPEARRLREAAAERERVPAVGEVFRDCPRCPEMVVVPAGSFMMGSPSSEQNRRGNEGPRRRVTIGSPFAVGVHEVTFAEWDACASSGGCGGYRPDDEGWGRGRRPVVNVRWDEAQSYVRWLSRETGEPYRLLSESEWEYAARAGTATRYWWGRDIGRNRANCDGCGSRWDDDRTASVGSFAANAFGLYDVHGNVWEWVQDCWNGSYAGAPRDGRAWESGECSRRVLRGGSWDNYPRYLRAADRYWDVTGSRDDVAGFRVARTFTP